MKILLTDKNYIITWR